MNYYNYANFFIGLLPLAWEKVFLLFPLTIGFRYTPTRVGKSAGDLEKSYVDKVYSHSRGKKSATYITGEEQRGILPLAWEKVLALL